MAGRRGIEYEGHLLVNVDQPQTDRSPFELSPHLLTQLLPWIKYKFSKNNWKWFNSGCDITESGIP